MMLALTAGRYHPGTAWRSDGPAEKDFRGAYRSGNLRAARWRMERKRASDFHPEVLRLFDQYVHGLIDRRGFLDRAARFAVNGLTATMLLDALNPRFAEAQQIAKDDARIK